MSVEEGSASRPVIVKRIGVGGEEHHGSAWKVAYADFVTAMMAFFLLLWLLNATTEEQKQGISNYFVVVGAVKGTSGSGGVLGGVSATDPGSEPPAPPSSNARATQPTVSKDDEHDKAGEPSLQLEKSDREDLRAQREEAAFEAASAALQSALAQLPDLTDLQKALHVEITEDGLRIHLVDQDKLSMFRSGSTELNENGRKLLQLVASVIRRLPNELSISGHTDSTPFQDGTGRTNWELSLGRANAARRALLAFGIPGKRVATVMGKADTEHLVPTEPTSPNNRRIAIVLLREPKETKAGVPEVPRIIQSN